MRTKRKPLAEVRRPSETKSGQKAPLQLVVPVGHDLRNARIRKGIELKKVGDDTRISMRHLQNLEEGTYSQLPGGMYNRAFLKVYCQYLDLDPAPYLERYEKEVAPKTDRPVKPKTTEPEFSTSYTIPPLAVWTLLFVLSVAGVYFSRQWIQKVFAPYIERPAVGLTEPAPPPFEPVRHPSESPQNPAVPGQPEAGTAEAAPMKAAASPAESVSADAGADVISPELRQAAALRLEVKVLEKCWVSVFSDGDNVLVKLLEPGDDQIFDANDRFYVILGNAAGVRLSINGEETRPLGRPGEVAKLLINRGTMKDLMQNPTG